MLMDGRRRVPSVGARQYNCDGLAKMGVWREYVQEVRLLAWGAQQAGAGSVEAVAGRGCWQASQRTPHLVQQHHARSHISVWSFSHELA